MERKICTKCGVEKDISEFCKDKYKKSGYTSDCKTCRNYKSKKYSKNNRIKINEYRKKYRKENTKEICKQERNKRKRTPWIYTFVDINKRCNNSKSKPYDRYGGRGIECRITSNELKFLWFRDKASEMKQASIDRIDNDGHYELSNCRYIELSINSGKDKRKPILQFDLDNNFIKEWESISEASRILKINSSDICTVAKKGYKNKYQLKTAGGFIWKYKEN